MKRKHRYGGEREERKGTEKVPRQLPNGLNVEANSEDEDETEDEDEDEGGGGGGGSGNFTCLTSVTEEEEERKWIWEKFFVVGERKEDKEESISISKN